MNDKIKCPKCGHEIPISEVLQHRLSEQINNEVEKRITVEKEKLETDLRTSLEKERDEGLKILKERLIIEAKKREEAEQKELEFIKKQTELEDKIKHQNFEIARKLHEERKLIVEKTEKEIEEKYSMKNLEIHKQLEDTKKALAEAQRKAQQGSMQTQGEVVELALEEILKQNFPHDSIEPVPKGITGADIIERVFSKTGQECGTIIWESKQTKAWVEDWVQKLKDDGRNIHGNILVLVSEVLPKEIKNFGLYKSIWVSNFSSILGLTTALRSQLIVSQKILASQTNKEEKKDILYDYLCSPIFANRIETMVENFLAMKNNLEKEKVAMNRIWTAREMQLNRIIENTAKMYGEIQGIAGSRLPSIGLLELESVVNKIEVSKDKKPQTHENKKSEDNNQVGLFNDK